MLQQASRVVPSSSTKNVTLSLSLARELPRGFSGTQIRSGTYVSDRAKKVWNDHLADRPMRISASGCEDGATCTATLQGPGVFPTKCYPYSWSITQEMLTDPHATWGPFGGIFYDNASYLGVSHGSPRFAINPLLIVSLVEGVKSKPIEEPEAGMMVSGYARIGLNGGSFDIVQCHLQAAILQYDVQILPDGSLVPLNATGDFISWANNTRMYGYNETDEKPITITAFTEWVAVLYNANVTASLPVPNSDTQVWAVDLPTMNDNAAKVFDWNSTMIKFSDPAPPLIQTYNKLMLRAGLLNSSWHDPLDLTDPGATSRQVVRGSQKLQENVFETNFIWFAGAAILDMFTILAIVPLYWGFWKIPTRLSMSPFDMAVAFDSPLTSSVHSAEGKKGVLSEMGNTRIAYGLVGYKNSAGYEHINDTQEEASPLRVLLAQSSMVRRPWKRARIDR